MHIALAGAALGGVALFFKAPGASRVVAEVSVLYAPAALERFAGPASEPIAQHASAEAALALARTARQRCRELLPPTASETAVGLACAAAIKTEPQRRGPDRVHIACSAEGRETTAALLFGSPQHTRATQDLWAALTLFNTLADAVAPQLANDLSPPPGDELSRSAA